MLRRLAKVSREQGFTLIELLVTMLIGMVVLLALYALVDTGSRASARVSDRAEAAQSGRVAMEQVVQHLRSNLCLKGNSAPGPLTAATPTSVTFYADVLGASGAATTDRPSRRTLTFASGQLTEQVEDLNGGTYPNYTWKAPVSRRIGGAVAQASDTAGQFGGGSVPYLSYYAYKADNTIDPYSDAPLPTPLSTADLARVGMVRIAFVSRPAGPSATTASDSAFDDVVTVRTIDPFNPQAGAKCSL